ncbi:AAA family ATPase [Flammeovirga yaeyamensis]|uniref:AAA family ATPase n=1 Tax=Flammeovirga yaeyamensis TaxID=367791 RepID=A0AAX1N2D8_9BACT|nr:AAA family ATPase [Flammeovirga yaeyamensis]MBB3695963.1 putative ATP-binding protein involved in virulence [Flammeovirga yaeyamensis]NMF34650.1 AAA family ATPase [Flammeovirga yaeyamensis]QWG00521.1 AAA family ATPase [Flammeovirga yaeyamensis]
MEKHNLPFTLKEFYIENFQGIKSLHIKELPPNANWIFLTGENGYGKTSILRGITIGLNGPKDLNDSDKLLWSKEEITKIELAINHRNKNNGDTKVRWVYKDNKVKYSTIPLAAYGPIRIPIDNVSSNNFKSNIKSLFTTEPDLLYPIEEDLKDLYNERLSKEKGAINDYYKIIISDMVNNNFKINLNEILSKFKDNDLIYSYISKVNIQLKEEVLKDPIDKISDPDDFQNYLNNYSYPDDKFELISKFLVELMDNILEIKVDNKNLIFIEKNDPKTPKKSNQLASGNRMLLSWVGDMLYRLGIDRISKPKDVEGIVIIDELDLHLHPKWQFRLPKILSKYLPNVQFIASTHSPLPLIDAPENSVFLKVNRSIENGITLDRWDNKIEINKLLPNSILTSPLFDLDNISSTQTHISEISTEDEFEEAIYNKVLKRKIQELNKQIND